jgi:hypothetical protein
MARSGPVANKSYLLSQAETIMASPSEPFLTVLDSSVEIAEAQSRFVTLMTAGAEQLGSLAVGWQGGQAKRDVHWHPEFKLWMCFDDSAANNRYWNAFGVGDPTKASGTLSIAVEVNSPFSGIDRRIAGAFARSSDGDLYLLHRGKVGGGRKGIGKTAFVMTYPGAISTVAENGQTSNAIIIGRFSQPEFQASVAAFVSLVDRFKAGLNVTPLDKTNGPQFKPEFFGTKILSPRAQIEAQCRHGIVINSLQGLLQANGYVVGNTQRIDLRIPLNNKSAAHFEVKTAADPYSIYAAIGQLYFHSRSEDVRIAVLPETCAPDSLGVVKKLGIRVLLYSWSGQVPVFKDLKPALQGIPRKAGE